MVPREAPNVNSSRYQQVEQYVAQAFADFAGQLFEFHVYAGFTEGEYWVQCSMTLFNPDHQGHVTGEGDCSIVRVYFTVAEESVEHMSSLQQATQEED